MIRTRSTTLQRAGGRHTGFVGVQWVISAYIVTFAASLLPSGSLADLRGRRRIVMTGIVVFLVSSAACGLATSAVALEVARAAHGHRVRLRRRREIRFAG
jgi:MFS family permease